ncbi:hypothetical protein [Marinitenerispora sediminis]|uniref:Uncharacterized protein n=1 Tax=Marinitenerispora sediminis TaxID=1931232 RepID=A0A368T733_9ACTN|nr:hypothetical protein [Marinitenerispora sediminis]RCV51011.1 hypothetical protein DEF23_21170 [Marinitenerispora sediminis]RCV52614.1 hypothetical protein DEF28_12445 [Marinitenerispora sediminis]RCV59581.1 hypothetical protein DEF24_09370 [Marinitenerispora sediminis]
MRVRRTRERCQLETCEWCDRDDWSCRFCDGSGWWRPEMPHRDGSGVIDWIRVEEPCRMCDGTGKEHNPLAGGGSALPAQAGA